MALRLVPHLGTVNGNYGDPTAPQSVSHLTNWIASREASALHARGFEQAVTTVHGEESVAQTTHSPSQVTAELVLISMSDPKAACVMVRSLVGAPKKDTNSK